MTDFLNQIGIELQSLQFLEILAVISGLAYVVLASKGNKWCFLFGLISSVIYVYITFIYHLYFDTSINIYYIIMSFIGWYEWSNKQEKSDLVINTTAKNKLITGILSSAVVCIILAFFVDRFSDAELAYADAFTTVFAIYATWMTVKRYIENWIIWIVVDLVASFMYFYKELYFTSLLFIIYTVIAIVGYFKWEKLLTKQKK